MSKPLSRIRVAYTEGDALKERHDIGGNSATGREAADARAMASRLALDGRRAGYEVTVTEFYTDGSRFDFQIA